jgi:hypothetical protein
MHSRGDQDEEGTVILIPHHILRKYMKTEQFGKGIRSHFQRSPRKRAVDGKMWLAAFPASAASSLKRPNWS